jgi:hypothetical protein
MSSDIQSYSGRFNQESIASKFYQHPGGRVEALAKIVLLAGFAIGQVAKIAVKCIIWVEAGDINTRFSLNGIGRDSFMLIAIFQRIFNEGICEAIAAPPSVNSLYSKDVSGRQSFIDTAADVFDWVYLDSYHFRTQIDHEERKIYVLGENTVTDIRRGYTGSSALPYLKDLLFDRGSCFAKFFNIYEDIKKESDEERQARLNKNALVL